MRSRIWLLVGGVVVFGVLVGFFVVVYVGLTAFMRTQLPALFTEKATGDGGPVTAAQ